MITHMLPGDSIRAYCGKVYGMRKWRFLLAEVTCKICLEVARHRQAEALSS